MTFTSGSKSVQNSSSNFQFYKPTTKEIISYLNCFYAFFLNNDPKRMVKGFAFYEIYLKCKTILCFRFLKESRKRLFLSRLSLLNICIKLNLPQLPLSQYIFQGSIYNDFTPLAKFHGCLNIIASLLFCLSALLRHKQPLPFHQSR